MLHRTPRAPLLARLIVCALIIIWCQSVYAAPPKLTLAWAASRREAVVTWSGLPAGACVELRKDGSDTTLPGTCQPSGQARLAINGVDARYAVKGGVWVLACRTDVARAVGESCPVGSEIAAARLAWLTTRLPIVAK